MKLSILDLMPIRAGGTAREAFDEALDLARHAEHWGYHRYWVAEHHNMAGVASAATAVAIGHIAGGTSRIRVGAGGIMLPNHAPLMVAEAFGTLETLYPGRIDLALGRAPGTDGLTTRALRRTLNADPDQFPQDVMELLAYFKDGVADGKVQAIPGRHLDVPVWILGSSHFGAYVAAALGLPYAFASHFAPADLDSALAIYRANFKPGARLSASYVMPAVGVVVAETDEEARLLFSSIQQAFINIRSGMPGPLPAPVEGFEAGLGRSERAILAHTLSCAIVGSPMTVKAGLDAFAARTGADEIIATANIFDPAARLRSFGMLADVAGLNGP